MDIPLICIRSDSSQGGGIYPWVSAHVLATIIVGAFGIVAFILYTLFVPLKDPFLPLHLFRNGQWDILQGIIAGKTRAVMLRPSDADILPQYAP
jgi:hypothetical protein